MDLPIRKNEDRSGRTTYGNFLAEEARLGQSVACCYFPSFLCSLHFPHWWFKRHMLGHFKARLLVQTGPGWDQHALSSICLEWMAAQFPRWSVLRGILLLGLV